MDEPVQALVDAFARAPDVLVQITRVECAAHVAYWLDEATWLEHGHALFAALAAAAAAGGQGTIHVVAAGSGRVFHQLVLARGKATAKRVTKRSMARDLDERAAFDRAMTRWQSAPH